MKNNALLSKLACAALCLSPLVLTGCQAMEGLFSDSSTYQSQEPYYHSGTKHSASTASSAKAATSNAETSTSKKVTSTKTSSSAVPVEPPSVHRGESSVPSSSPTVNTSNTSSTGNSSTIVKVPSAPTVAPANSPSMLAPTANQ